MRNWKMMILVPAVLVAAACGRDSAPAMDAALDSDLRLAGEAAPGYEAISPLELQEAEPQPVATQPRPAARAPARTTTAPRATTTRTTAPATGTAGTTRAPEPVEVTRRNTGRDAAIGATAGAVLGATTSRNKVKGGLIGAAIGGVAGAVIGHSIDVQRDTVYR